MQQLKTLAGAIAIMLVASSVHAGGWTLDPALSNVAYGSIKNEYIGESNSFQKISGAVSDDGVVSIDIALASVETLIDIRNERMVEFVFNNSPSAKITATIDMAELEKLPVGGATDIETAGALSFLGEVLELDASLFVMRLGDDQVLVTTNGMLMLATDEIGVDAGVDKLQELAGLDSITRVSPVTLRLVFNRDS